MEQCARYNGKVLIANLPPNAKWVPKYTGSKFTPFDGMSLSLFREIKVRCGFRRFEGRRESSVSLCVRAYIHVCLRLCE